MSRTGRGIAVVGLSAHLEAAFLRVWASLKEDPAELGRRLARRRMRSVARAACLALRADDRRIASWVKGRFACGAGEGDVHVTRELIRELTRPVSFPDGGSVRTVAAKLGVTELAIRRATDAKGRTGVFRKWDERGEVGIFPNDKKGVEWAMARGVGLDSEAAKVYSRGRKRIG